MTGQIIRLLDLQKTRRKAPVFTDDREILENQRQGKHTMVTYNRCLPRYTEQYLNLHSKWFSRDPQCCVSCLFEDNTDVCLYAYLLLCVKYYSTCLYLSIYPLICMCMCLFMQWWCTPADYMYNAYWLHCIQ